VAPRAKTPLDPVHARGAWAGLLAWVWVGSLVVAHAEPQVDLDEEVVE